MNHCWKDKADDAMECFGEYSPQHIDAMQCDGTCMLPGGHDGPHEFIDDVSIVVTFPDRIGAPCQKTTG